MSQLTRISLASVLALTLAGILTPSAVGQAALHSIRAEAAWDGFGARLESLGDLDGDGVSEVAVSCVGRGVVRVLSGADGHERFVLRGGKGFGLSLAHGDYDGDGLGDIAVGAPLHAASPGGDEAGAVFLYSGSDGTLIHVLYGGVGDQHLGQALCALGDLDGGGADELLVGDVNARWRLVRGEDYSQLNVCSLEASGPWASLQDAGQGTCWLGDVDGDGLPDWGLLPSPLAEQPAGVRLLLSSDPTGSRLLSSGSSGDGFGRSLASVGDMNGDGVADIAVGAPGDDSLAPDGGAIHVFSGRTFELLFVVSGEHPNGRLGGAVAGLGDVNDDGVPDLCATAQDGAFGVLHVFASPVLGSSAWSPVLSPVLSPVGRPRERAGSR